LAALVVFEPALAEVTAMRGYFVGNGWRDRYRRVMSTE
jgi:hypothetical protein